MVEPKTAKDAFLTENPWEKHAVNDVPLLIGVTADEGMLGTSRTCIKIKLWYKKYFLKCHSLTPAFFYLGILSVSGLLEEWQNHYERMFPLAFGYFDTTDSNTALELSKSIKKFYFNDQPISFETRRNFIDVSYMS